jgi:hypothetical protein
MFLPVIFVTMRDDFKAENGLRKGNCQDWLPKPRADKIKSGMAVMIISAFLLTFHGEAQRSFTSASWVRLRLKWGAPCGANKDAVLPIEDQHV